MANLEERILMIIINHSISQHGFTMDMHRKITNAKSIDDLVDVAKERLKLIPEDEGFITGIGSMHTGTDRTYDHNLTIFDFAYTESKSVHKLPIFYQLAFQEDFQRLRREYNGKDSDFLDELFNKFYKPIMHHKNLKKVLLMPGWHKSHGATQEFNMLEARKALGLNLVEYIDVEKEFEHILPRAEYFYDI